MGATAFPSTDDKIAFGDEIGRTPELEVRERRTEIHHEVPHVFAAPARGVQRILKQHVRRGEFIDDLRVPRVPQNPSNQRPTMALLSCSRDISSLLMQCGERMRHVSVG